MLNFRRKKLQLHDVSVISDKVLVRCDYSFGSQLTGP